MDEHGGVPVGSGWRTILAYDMSQAAEMATDLIAGTAWPPGTQIRIVSNAAGIGPMLSSFANLRETRSHARDVRQLITEAHELVARRLSATGVAVDSRIVGGHAGSAIVAEANQFDADLVVCGSRSKGAIASAMLGSVSRELVQSARCSVLVVRNRSLSSVLLATDGSMAAKAGTAIVATSPLFAGARIRVVAVGDRTPDSDADGAPDPAADAAVAELVAHGRSATSEVRLGEPATEIVAAAREWLPDVLVMGSNGERLLRRLILGSVARKVIDGVSSTVLVARARRRS